jgi:membrane peptidoglycan carboxypeptidase
MPALPRDQRGISAPGALGVVALASIVMGLLVSMMALPFIGTAAVTARSISDAVEELPSELETLPLAQRTEILDRDGNVIAIMFDEDRVAIPLVDVSRTMLQSIVAIEDYRFYEHGALDLKGTLRALIANEVGAGGTVVQGGSSITQQMVKLTLLAQAKGKKERLEATDDTYARKIRELKYAIAFEQAHNKDWILERYLNLAYFGDGAYGIQSAARHYFDKDAKDLDLRESAMLAGLVKNPAEYDPTENRDLARARRNVVLDRLAQLNVITKEKAEATKKMDLGLNLTKTKNGCYSSVSPVFCNYVQQYFLKNKNFGKTEKEREKLLLTGGLTIQTTLDIDYQKAADAATASTAYPTDQAIAGLALVEPGTGQVRALSQSRPLGDKDKLRETSFNYTIPDSIGNAPGFQPGSTFKVFVLTSAIMQNIPLRWTVKAPVELPYNLENYEDCDNEPYGYGPAPAPMYNFDESVGGQLYDLYSGTRTSVNTFYMLLEQQTGICQPFRLAKAMGVELTEPTGDEDGNGAERVPTFTLGVTNASPLEMAEAYATFAARGLHCDSTPIEKVLDADGKPLKTFEPNCQQVFPEPVADAVNDVLRGVVSGDGFAAAEYPGVPAAGKTGTTNGQRSVWFVGYTPNMAAAAMLAGVRNSDGAPIPLQYQTVGGSYISSASGSLYAAPMWGDVMPLAAQEYGWEDFVPVDQNLIIGANNVIPDLIGYSQGEAFSVLQAMGFSPTVAGYERSDAPRDTVIAVSPGPGTKVATGTQVLLTLSEGDRRGGGNNGGGGGRPGGGRP